MPLKFKQLDSGDFVAEASLVLRTLECELPLLDVLVRESIQNSLDAATEPNSPVKVDFSITEVSKEYIYSIFGEPAEGLKNKFAHVAKCKVLAIRDTGTTGLTGDYNDKKSKIHKLIADIGQANSSAGAGGSWGLGKTIYYQLGTNIVGFYSQTNGTNNKPASSLSFGYIENQKYEKRLIKKTPTGIAWWLNEKGAPMTDRRSIKPILNTLDIPPFQEEETGTCIIIPFFGQSETHLNNNTEANNLPWETDEAEYIKIAIQRWYSNRLIKTPGKAILKASVNGKSIGVGPAPIFKVLQSLRKLTDNFRKHVIKSRNALRLIPSTEEQLGWRVQESDSSRKNAYLKAIYLNNTVQNDTESRMTPVGWLAARLLTESELRMTPPSNLPSPHKYIFGSTSECDEQLPIVAMTRSPQMIVAYDTKEWRSGLKLDKPGEYIIALFVLNSDAILLDGTSLEEYIRGIENSTHSDWRNSIVGSKNNNLLPNLRKNVVNALREAFFNNATAIENLTQGESIRAQLGAALLPSDFGKAGTRPPIEKGNNNGGSELLPPPRQSQPSLEVYKTQYTDDTIQLFLTIFNAKKPQLMLTIEADAGSGNTMPSKKWDEEIKSPQFPFSLEVFKITGIRTIKGKGRTLAFNTVQPKDVQLSLDSVGASLTFNQVEPQQLQAELTLKTSHRLVNPVIKLATAEVKK